MNLSQLVLTIIVAAAATTSSNAAKQVKEVEVLKRDKQHNRKLRNHHQKMRKLNRAMSISPIITGNPTPSPVTADTNEPTPSPADTNNPTNEPTQSPTSNDCDDIGDVKQTRSGVQYDLQYDYDQSCRDANGNRYEYGEIDNIDSFDDCAETCVQDVPSALLPHFRGIDFVCQNQNSKEQDSCRCLYDAGTLESNSRAVSSDGVFDSTDTSGTGKGSVSNGFSATNRFQRVGTTTEEDKEVVCVKLESSRFVDVAIA